MLWQLYMQLTVPSMCYDDHAIEGTVLMLYENYAIKDILKAYMLSEVQYNRKYHSVMLWQLLSNKSIVHAIIIDNAMH